MEIKIKVNGDIIPSHTGFSGDMTATISGGEANSFTISVRVDNAPTRDALYDRVYRAVETYGNALLSQVSKERALSESKYVPPLSGNL